MNVVAKKLNLSFERIAKKLERRECGPLKEIGQLKRASVAMILSKQGNEIEILFIQRSAHDRDPWSGHIAFPGGKLEEGEIECQGARRETYEEIGIDLEQGRYLGRLSDIIGANLPVMVSCCLFSIDRKHCFPLLNEEVGDLFWVSLSDLRDRRRHLQCSVAFDDKRFKVPAISLPVENKPVLWGITYRLVMQFMSLVEDENETAEGFYKLPEMVVLDEED